MLKIPINKFKINIWEIKNTESGHYKVVKEMLKKYPEYKEDVAKCLRARHNHRYGFDLIKEVIPG